MKSTTIVKLSLELDGKEYAKGFKIDPKEFYDIFPKEDPNKQQDNLETTKDIVQIKFKALCKAGYRKLMEIEQVGYFNNRFDFESYKRHLIEKEAE